ncbi:MAG: SPFH domain-containing protein [Paracoccaceae bacterium]|nr:SPFH domain-containing protein [Paracoccaceae bacterium]
MGILDFLTGEFIDVIHWTDDTRDTMVWRFDREDHEIKYGAKLTVRESQAAVFVHEGQLADVFLPGLYMLETNNLPILTTLQHWDHGFRSPFKSEIYFVSTRRFTDLKWGTKNPIMIRDPEFGPTRLRAYGTYTVKVSDPGKFLVEIVGTDGEFTMDEISYQVRNIIVQEFSRVISATSIPVLDMAANTRDLGKLVAEAISETISSYGIELPELYIENISLPPAVEKALDERTSRGVIGSLEEHLHYKAGEALGLPNSGAGQAMGMGMGAGMGMAMSGTMPGPWQTQAATPATPPPPPVEHVWHLAKNGQTTGPFSKADLGQKAADGGLTRESWVWTPGQDGWMHAEDTELAELFTVAPPPPPEG